MDRKSFAGTISSLLVTALAWAQPGEIPWTQLTAYPSACSAGSFISALADAPTCTAVSITLQEAYEGGNTIDMTSAEGEIDFGTTDDNVDTEDLQQIENTTTFDTAAFERSGSELRVVRDLTIDLSDDLIIYDEFTGTTQLDNVSHPMVVGSPWVKAEEDGSMYIRSNSGSSVALSDLFEGVIYTAEGDYSDGADYQIETEITNVFLYVTWLILRYQTNGGSTNYYAWEFDNNSVLAESGDMKLWKVYGDPAVWTELEASDAWVSSGDYLVFRVYGSQIECWVNDVLVMAASDSDISGTGKAALGCGDIPADNSSSCDAFDHNYFKVRALTHQVSGPVAYFENADVTETTGTIQDHGSVLRAFQENPDAQGPVLDLATASDGLLMRLNDDGTFYDPTPTVFTADGYLGVGYAQPEQALAIDGQLTIGVPQGSATTGVQIHMAQNQAWLGIEVQNEFYGNTAYFGSTNGADIGTGTTNEGVFLMADGNAWADRKMCAHPSYNHYFLGGLLIDQQEPDEPLIIQSHSSPGTFDQLVIENSGGTDQITVTYEYDLNMEQLNAIRFFDTATGTSYMGFKAPAAYTVDPTARDYIMPLKVDVAENVLGVDGSGNLNWKPRHGVWSGNSIEGAGTSVWSVEWILTGTTMLGWTPAAGECLFYVTTLDAGSTWTLDVYDATGTNVICEKTGVNATGRWAGTGMANWPASSTSQIQIRATRTGGNPADTIAIGAWHVYAESDAP